MSGMDRVIWQYWETKGEKPAFVDDLYRLAMQNSGVRVIRVTPETVHTWLPHLEPEVMQIAELAHKADMLRARLVLAHGGMWLDSDAVVLKDLNWILDGLRESDFVCFNEAGKLVTPPRVKVNCFAARRQSRVVGAWVERQRQKLAQPSFGWEEIGTDLLDSIVLDNPSIVRFHPFSLIAPVSWRDVDRFLSTEEVPGEELNAAHVVMLSNKTLEKRASPLRGMTVDDIINSETYLSHFLRRAAGRQDTSKVR
jgi:hypothetical protein